MSRRSRASGAESGALARTGRRLARRAARLRAPIGRALRPVRRAMGDRPSGTAREIHLAWSEDPARSLTICWSGRAGDGSPRVQIADAGGGPWREVCGCSAPLPASRGHQHTVVVRDLEPGRAYAYRVACGGEETWSERFDTRTAPEGDDASFEAVFLCDVGLAGRRDGTTDATVAVLDAIRRHDPLVVLGGGDYAYANRDTRFLDPGDAVGAWFDQMQPLFSRAPFVGQLGNHEVELVERVDDWAPRLPRRAGAPSGLSYSMQIGPAHIVGLHAPGRAPSAADLDWLESDLESPAARRARWRIVFQHAPIVGHGRSHPARPELMSLMPLFDRLGVDLHLSGHDQSFERTHPLRADGSFVPPAEGGSRYAAGAGVVYAKVSPAGKLSERGLGFSRLPEHRGPEIAARSDAGHHWARLMVDREALRVVVEQLPARGEPVSVVDAFSLVDDRTADRAAQ